jgi:ribosome-binding protein aMBF1 (putative translation factor)
MPMRDKALKSLIDSLPSKSEIDTPTSSQPGSRAELMGFLDDLISHKRLGEALKAAREEQKLSTRALAKQVDLSHTRIQAIESANATLEMQTVAKIAEALGYQINVQFIPKDSSRNQKTFGVLI